MLTIISLLGDLPEVRLAQWNSILGICLIVLGVMLYAFSKRIIMIAKHKDEIDPKDKGVLTLRIIGLVLLLAGLIFMAIR